MDNNTQRLQLLDKREIRVPVSGAQAVLRDYINKKTVEANQVQIAAMTPVENVEQAVIPEVQPEQQIVKQSAYVTDTSPFAPIQETTIGELPQNPEAVVLEQPVGEVVQSQSVETAKVEPSPEKQLSTATEPSLNNIFAEDKAINEAIATLETLMSRGIRETLAISFNRAATIFDSRIAKQVEEEQKTKIELEQREMKLAQEEAQLAEKTAVHEQNVAQANAEIAATVAKVNSENEVKIAETNAKADQILIAANTKAAQTIKAGEIKAEEIVSNAKIDADKTLNTVKEQLKIVASNQAAAGMPQPTAPAMSVPITQSVMQNDLSATANTQPQNLPENVAIFPGMQPTNPVTQAQNIQTNGINQGINNTVFEQGPSLTLVSEQQKAA